MNTQKQVNKLPLIVNLLVTAEAFKNHACEGPACPSAWVVNASWDRWKTRATQTKQRCVATTTS